MKTGKLPEHTLKRSVLNPIRYKSSQLQGAPMIGRDGAVIGNMVTAMSTTAFCYEGNEIYALDNALNNVVAGGGIPNAISVAVLMPEHSEEADLRRIMDSIAKKAEQYEVDMIGGHTELIPSVNYPTVTITAFGNVLWKADMNQKKMIRNHKDIVMTKWAGLYGGSLLANLKEKELTSVYAPSYIAVAKNYMNDTSLLPELQVIKKLKEKIGNLDWLYAAHDVTNGGVFGALWQILSVWDSGCDVFVDQIYMKQEIIEVCEFFDINPYMLNGQGSLLLIVENGNEVVDAMRENGIPASVIGHTSETKDRGIHVGEEKRFIVPPKGDGLNVVLYGQKRQI